MRLLLAVLPVLVLLAGCLPPIAPQITERGMPTPVANVARAAVVHTAAPDAVHQAYRQAFDSLGVAFVADSSAAGTLYGRYDRKRFSADLRIDIEPHAEGTRAILASHYDASRRGAHREYRHLPLWAVGKARKVLAPQGDEMRYEPELAAAAPEGACEATDPSILQEAAAAGSGGDETMPVLIGGLKALQRKIGYPSAAKLRGVEGQVWVDFIVDEAGEVACARVVSGLPYGLSEEALDAVQTSRFEPGTVDGEPVRVRMSLPITFIQGP